ncbi:hypothetical protein PAJ_0139 [Pantoea ananatis AJ13355]|uniref:Uncharacterized protein n=1 Tax=Pantoea ananatis (strain AJ13355) TaxID=932677 RepID=A0A0H3KT52_PANAA|nr:hypothetical protein PAJ_0139 [Pantoea ananatis AJ13355]
MKLKTYLLPVADKKEPPSGGSFRSLRLFGHCCNFSSKISLNFFDAFAHFKADEVDHVSALLFQRLANGFAWIDNECLTGQRDFAGEFLHTAFNHLLCDLFWLTRLHRDVQLNLVFFINHFRRNVFWLNKLRFACRNVHCDLFDQIFVSAFSRNQNADTCAVQVAAQFFAFQKSNATNVDVLADFSNQGNTFFFELCFQHFNVGDAVSRSSVKNFISKRLETAVFCYEVSLAVHFQNHTVVTNDFGFDYAISSNVTRFFRCFNCARLTHVFNRQLDVAARFSQRFFAVHHACASTLTQFFYQCSGNFSHSRILGSYLSTSASEGTYLRKIYSVPPS